MIVIVCALAALLWVTPGWRRISIPQRERKGAVDQAVLLDVAAAALKAGVSIPSMLKAVHKAMSDPMIAQGQRIISRRKPMISHGQPMISRGKRAGQGKKAADRCLDEVANLLLMGASWEEAWKNAMPIYTRLGAVLQPAWDDGVAPVALLERGAQSLRFSRARHAKEAAAKLGSKLVIPLSVFFLPAFMLLGVLPVVVAAAGKIF